METRSSTETLEDRAGAARRERFILALVLTGGAFSRVLFTLATAGRTPEFDKYFWLAGKLALTGWVPEIVFADCPLYIYLVGTLHLLLGLDATGVRLLQALLSPVTVFLVWSVTRRLAGRRAALSTALIMAFYPAMILYDTQPMTFMWINMANAAGLFFLYLAADTRGAAVTAAAGLCLGLSVLLRPNVLLWLPFLFAWLILQGRVSWRSKAATATLAGSVLAATVLPVSLLNLRGGGDFVLVTASGGLNLFGGNNPESTPLTCSTFPVVRDLQNSIVGEFVDQPITPEHIAYRRVAEWLAGRNLSAKEASRHWTGETLSYLRRDPASFTSGLLSKARHFFHAYESHDTDSAYLRWQFFGKAPLVLSAFIWSAALGGALFSLRRWRRELPLLSLFFVYFANTVIFYVSSRLRLPVMIPVSFYAGVGIVTLWEKRRRIRGAAAAALALAAGLLVLILAYPTGATADREREMSAYTRSFMPVAKVFLRGKRKEALELFRAQAEGDRRMKGIIAEFLGPYSGDPQVRTFLDDVLAPQPTSPDQATGEAEVMRWRGVAKFSAKDYRGALGDFSLLLEKEPYDWDAYYARAVTHTRLGNWAEALSDLRRSFEYGKKFQSGLHALYFELGTAAARVGEEAEAMEYLRRALFVKPAYPEAAALLEALRAQRREPGHRRAVPQERAR